MVEGVSGCLLQEEVDGSDLAKETNTVLEGLRILEVWDTVSDVFEPLANQARRDRSRHLTATPDTIQQPIDNTTSYTQRESHVSASVFLIVKEALSFNGNPDLFVRPSFSEGPMAECVEHFRWIRKSSTSGGSGSKTSNTSEKQSTLAMLEPETGSCTMSNQAQTLIL